MSKKSFNIYSKKEQKGGTSYAALSVGAPWIFRFKQHLISQWLCTSDVVLLAVTGVFQQYMVYQVKKIRLQGYYIFSQKLKHVIRLPFATITYGTAAILLVMVWEPHISILPIVMLLRIIMVAEVIFAGSFMSVYIGNVHQYNSLESHPDVLKSLYSPLQPSSSLEGLSYYDGGRLSDQQMALLQYQQENLNFLSEEIMRLQECLSKYERSDDGMTPQVDLAHLLAARDQELRTLSAEMAAEEPKSWDELYSIDLMPSELFLKFREQIQGFRVGLNLEFYNAPTNECQAKLVLKPLSHDRRWKFIYEPLHHDVRLVSKKIPLTKFLNLQVGIGHSFQLHTTGWKWKLTTCLGGDGVSRIRNKTCLAHPGITTKLNAFVVHQLLLGSKERPRC
ncbi:hypothetical protein Ccrd_020581 [Cynara cardunculus var. scolymus]|uniref:DUF7781 domain-containing protein n=1 Tax=Cynara cardunculus var. scolymus TaxID=59895 RepID=A0A118K0D5_CYNCS|nr:hypothetical protein Ccrd_020581 [Cynara cardunculus var. scolymus]